jgi:hypothetical protein
MLFNGHNSLVFRLILFSTFLLASGCASIDMPTHPKIVADGTQAATCMGMYSKLDQDTETANVRNAGLSLIAHFPYLRVDRFFSALARDVASQDSALDDSASLKHRAAIFERLRKLDLQARRSELLNLSSHKPELRHSMAMLEQCSMLLTQKIVNDRSLAIALLKSLSVPDDYVTAYRAFGGYYLTRIPFSMGVQRLEKERLDVISQPRKTAEPRLLLVPSKATTEPSIARIDVARMLKPDPNDPLRLPNPSPNDLEKLFLHFAPSFDIALASADDRPGALAWGAFNTLKVDSALPVVYSNTSLTRYVNHHLLQLSYTLWFPARPKAQSSAVDLLAGHLDGLVIRVTLAPDGTPLVYDSIHPCGCYHTFFTVGATKLKPAPDSMTEWAFMPRALPAMPEKQRLIIQVAASTHYIDSFDIVDTTPNAAERSVYQIIDYDELNALAAPALAVGQPPATRSAFDSRGFIPGTERLESFLFWPMGIANAGAMRQAGRQPTAFIGRRHFDDADLFESRFVFDRQHFQ